MALAKSYALIRELNRPRHPAILWVLGLAVYLCVLVVTGRYVLASESRRQIGGQNVKYGLRFTHWFVRRGWPGVSLYDDPTFQLGDDLPPKIYDELLRFTRRRASRRPGCEVSIDILDILARQAHAALRAKRQADFDHILSSYSAQVDRVLVQLAEVGTVPGPLAGSPSTNRFSVEDARAAFSDFHRLMRNGPQWYVISGTFLGVVREGGWLPHDYDIDVGINIEVVDFSHLQTLCAANDAFSIAATHFQDVIGRRAGAWTIEAKPVMLKLVHRTGVNLDVFVHHLDGEHRWHGSSVHRWGNSEFMLSGYELDGRPVLGPKDFDTYLTENYGQNWRVPVTSFNGTVDTPNLEVAPNLMSISLMLRKAALLGGRGTDAGQRILEFIARDGALMPAADGWRFSPQILGTHGDC